MALSITNRGTGTHNTGAASFTLSPGSNCTAGATVALSVAADNSSSGGATNDFTTVTDTLGNTWTKQQAPVFDNGAASAGVQGAIYTTQQNGGTLTTSTTITVSFGSSPVAKTWTLTEVTPAGGKSADIRTSGSKAAGATATAATSGASGTINVGEVGVFAIFIEAGTTQTCTGDSDTTNGTWSTLQYAEIGSTTSGSCIASQAKLQTTANSTQTYDITLGISSDYHASWVVFQEVTPPINVTPTTAIAASAATAPTITLGGLTITPTTAVAAAAAAAPTVTRGPITVTPSVAIAAATAVAPSVSQGGGGNQNVTPTPAIASATAANLMVAGIERTGTLVEVGAQTGSLVELGARSATLSVVGTGALIATLIEP